MRGYRAPWLLSNRHLNTIFSARIAARPQPRFRRERWDTPDGDFIDLDFLEADSSGEVADRHTPLVVLFHGLEGSSSSAYARSLMWAVRRRGWRGVVAHFRGCSGEPNRLPRAYHAGDSAEADFVLRRLKARALNAPIYAVGVSLGGNVLCKWLGERGEGALSIVARASAISAPVDLHAAGDALEHGVGKLYTYNFLRTLRRGAETLLRRFPGLFDEKAMKRARTLRAFDDVVTGPIHGFAGVDDYWTRASALPVLKDVRVPLFLLNALDDPFYSEAALPTPAQLSSSITVERPAQGGHVGFARAFGDDWLSARVLRFFDAPITPQ